MKYKPGGPVSKPKVLLGEGVEEVYFFSALLDHLDINDIQVVEYGGKNKLREGLRALVKRSGFKHVVSLAVTRDADYPKDPAADESQAHESAFTSVCDALQNANLPVPTKPAVKASGKIDVSVFILPGDGQAGMLEDLCLASVQDEAMYPCLMQYFECVEKHTGTSLDRYSRARAYVQAWLAALPDPAQRLGEAAQSKNVKWNHPAFNDFKTFLSSI